jgi:HK97 family phage major capsid protein
MQVLNTWQAKSLREELPAKAARAKEILDVAQAESRELSVSEANEFDRLISEVNGDLDQLDIYEQGAKNMQSLLSNASDSELIGTLASRNESRSKSSQKWQTLDGKPVTVLAKHERFSDIDQGKPALSFGKIIRGAITGRWDGAQAEVKALGENTNWGGGYLVPDQMGRMLIDMARARSVLVQAGAQTVTMNSDHLTIAKVTSDPVFQVKVENKAFTDDTALAFGAVGFTAYTIGTVIAASRELAEDSPNFASLVEEVVTKALGAELDRLGLRGTGSQEPLGITNYPDVGSTGSVGAIAWEDVHTAMVDVQSNNGEANAFVAHPETQGDLNILTSGDGTNSAKLWLGPPPGVSELTRYSTTNLTTANLIVGDFRQMLIGLRQRPLVEVTTTGGDSFQKHQVRIKITWRGDFGLAHPDHFHVLGGITS